MNYSQQKIGGKTILCDITSFLPNQRVFESEPVFNLEWDPPARPGRCGSAEEPPPPQRLPWTFSYLRSCENTSLLWDNLELFLNSLAGHGLLLALDHMTQTPTELPTSRASKAEMAFLLAGCRAETLLFKEKLLVISWKFWHYMKSSNKTAGVATVLSW